MKVLFVCSGRRGDINSIILNQGESLRKAGMDLDYYMVPGRGMKSYMKSIKPLRAKIKEGNHDVIHAHYAFCAYLVNMAAMGLHKPLVVSLMGSDIWFHKWYPALVRTWSSMWGWKAIIVKSVEMRERVGIQRAEVIPNGVNMERFCEMDKVECQKKLGWDSAKKQVLLPANPADPRKNSQLAEKAIALLQSDIEYHGMCGVPNEQTPTLYNAADVVVLPSLYEGSANAVKEAMACDAPLVTTDMGDCRERIDGVEGCYVANTYEVEEFADLLGKALEFGGKTKGRERLLADGIADYQIAERLMKIYQESIKV